MAAFTLYIDTVSGSAVTGIANPADSPLPPFVQGDTIAIIVYLLDRNPTYPITNPFKIIPTTGLSLQMALGTKVGGSTTIYASQYSWTSSADLTYFYASLALNTTEITNLLGGAASAGAFLEVKYLSGSLPTTVLSKSVTVQAGVVKAGSITPVPGQTFISAETANATFLTRQISGAIILTNPNTGGKMAVYLGDDGAFHAEPVS